ncbi:heavy metal translocating P-type ATPase [Methylotuvimicrobium sp. KM1]|uniref:heavy metal translocating P-type ATPase n=1 Tax=Methylotuvimicrobium sp. KM1 TaxID=3377707 RepID=UPI00384AF1D9
MADGNIKMGNMDTIQTTKHFSIAHRLNKRLRIIVPSLRKDRERAYILQILLLKREGVKSVNITPQIGSLTIVFDPEKLPFVNLLHLLDAVIANIGVQPREALKSLKRDKNYSDKSAQDFVIGVGDMSCASCALYLEMILQRQPDVLHASVNYISETARIKTYLPKDKLFKIIADNGYQGFSIDSLAERKLLFDLERKHLHKAKRQILTLSKLSVPVWLLSAIGSKSRTLLLIQAVLAGAAIIGGGRDIFKKAFNQAKRGAAEMDSLVALGVGAAYIYSIPALFRPSRHVYFDAATAIIDFVTVGRYLEELAKNRAVQDIRKLVNLQPHQATLLKDGKELKIMAEQIEIDDILLIRPGERIPADGEVIKGLSSVNEAMVTGSAMPAIKEPGHKLYDGSINGSGVLQMRATATGKDTFLSGLIHMVDQAQASKLKIQKTVDSVASVFVPSVIVLSGATFGGWLLAGERVAHALSNAIAVLLISCPCALGLATPAATMVGTGQAARRGIYIRNGEVLETAASIDTVLFDKTGTITEGIAEITDLFNISDFDDERLLQLAASAEFNSEHFLGQAIVRYAKERGMEIEESSQFHNAPDRGIRAQIGDSQLLLGSDLWMKQHQIDLTPLKATSKKLAQQGKTLVYLAIDRRAAALFAATDTIRPNARQVVEHLHQAGIDTWMVTGDTELAARHISEQVGIVTVYSEADPAKKLALIRQLRESGHKVAMIGDGINDAPALAAANVSLVIDKGTDIAIEAADLVLLDGDIGKIADAIELSENTLSIIKQNLTWAFGYNAIAIPFAVAGKLNPAIASAAMALSSVSVIVNSLRLNRKK